jgi:hypothetical protein
LCSAATKRNEVPFNRTSKFARLAVAHAFAVRGPVSLVEGLNASSVEYSAAQNPFGGGSTSEVSKFYLSDVMDAKGRNFLRLHFTQLQGRAMLSKTWVDLPATATWNLKFGRSKSNPSYYGCIATSNVDSSHELPLNGSMVEGLSLKYELKDGEPITLSLINNGHVLATSEVLGCF